MTVRVETYALARPVPYLVQRGTTWTLTCPIRYQGSLVAPDSGTVTIVDPDDTELVSAAAATISGSVAQYDWTIASDADEGAGYEVRWTLTIGGVQYPPYVITAYVADYVPVPCVTSEDLYTREPELRYQIPQAQGDRGDESGWQPQLDAAYYELIQYLLDEGEEPWRIREVHGYRQWLLLRSLELVCLAAGSGGSGEHWSDRAKHYAYGARLAQGRLRIQYRDEEATVRRAPGSVIYLAPIGRPAW